MNAMIKHIRVLCFLMLFSSFLLAQRNDLEREIDRTRQYITQVTQLINQIPGLTRSTVGPTIQSLLTQAQQDFASAERNVNNNFPTRARLDLAKVRRSLRQIEELINRNSDFKLTFQRDVIQEIQALERAAANSNQREVLFLLERSRSFQLRADNLVANGQLFRSAQYYQYSLYFARQGLRILNPDRDVITEKSYWLGYFQETRTLFDRTRLLLDQNDNPELENLLLNANLELNRVERLYEERDYGNAQQRLIVVNRALYRIMDLLEKEGMNPQQKARKELQTLEEDLLNLESQLSSRNDEVAQKIIRRVRNITVQIENAISQSRFILARRRLLLANQLMVQVYRRLDNNNGNTRPILDQALQEAKQVISSFSGRNTNNNYAGILNLMEKNLRSAEIAAQNKRRLQASLYLKHVNLLALKYDQLTSGNQSASIPEKEARANLERLTNLLNRLENSAESDQAFNIRFENAQTLKMLAEKAFSSNDFALADALSNIGIDLLTR